MVSVRTVRIPVVALLFLILVNASASARQRTWYVNSQTGLDGFDGLSASTPKRTLDRAISESSSGDIIVVTATRIDYGPSTNGEPTTIQVGDKKLILRSTEGTPRINSVLELNNTLTAPSNVLVFDQGPFFLAGGLTMRKGNIVGARNLLLGGTVKFVAQLPGKTNSSFDAPPGGYSPTVDLEYDGVDGVVAQISSGLELRGPGIDYSLNNLTIGSSHPVKFTLLTSLLMKGILRSDGTASTIDLSGNTIILSGAHLTHAVGGDVSNGTLAFWMDGGNAAIAGAFALPKVFATSIDAPHLLKIGAATSVFSLEAIAGASIDVPLAATVGKIGSTSDNIVNSGTGEIVLGSAAVVNGNVTLKSKGISSSSGNQAKIVFRTAAPVTIHGDVTNDAEILVRDSDDSANDGSPSGELGNGIIVFPDQDIVINGSVRNGVTVTGSLTTNTKSSHHGQIRFLRGDGSASGLMMRGSVLISSSSDLSGSFGTIRGMGSILVGRLNSDGLAGATGITGSVWIDGGVTNNSVWLGLNAVSTLQNNGRFDLAARGTGKLGTATRRIGPILNISRSVNGSGNGDIILGGALTSGGFNGTTITEEGLGGGGIIQTGNESVSATVVRNARNSPSRHLLFGVGPGSAGKSVELTALISTGLSTSDFIIPVDAFFIVDSSTTIAGGTVKFSNASNTVAWSLGDLTVTGGMLDLSGAQGSAGSIISRNIFLSDGTINLGTGARAWRITGPSVILGSSSTNPVFQNGSRTTLTFVNPVPTGAQTITLGAAEPSFPGSVSIDNTTGLVDAVRIAGGNLRISGKLKFARNGPPYRISLDGARLFVLSTSGSLDFENQAGYRTLSSGVVSMSGVGSSEIGGGGSFGDFEVNNTAATKVAANTGAMKGTLYLTRGVVYNSGSNPLGDATNVIFDEPATPPTIVVNAGSFASARGPVFTSPVNVTYIGTDKKSSTELPTDSTKLLNLIVATTNGSSPGRGVVTLTTSSTVNGSLIIQEGQTLAIDVGRVLVIKGVSAVLNGNIVNKAVPNFTAPTDVFMLSRKDGTAITGSGTLCDVYVAPGSVGNGLSGPRAVVNQLLGSNGAWGGGDDFDTSGLSFANGELHFGAGSSSLTVTLGAGYKNGTQLGNVTTSNRGNRLILGADLVASGNMSHGGGRIELGANTLNLLGTDHTLTGGAEVIGTGNLRFMLLDATRLTVKESVDTVAVNVDVVSSAPQGSSSTLTLTSGGEDLCVANNLSLSGSTTILDIGAGRTLSVLGSSTTIAKGTTVKATAGGTSGILHLKPSRSPLFFRFAENVTIPNLLVSNDVILDAPNAVLTVAGVLSHDGGNLDLRNNTLVVSGIYRRTGTSSYTSDSGYFEFAGPAFDQGPTDLTIRNLRLSGGSAALVGTGVVSVSKNLDVRLTGTFTQSVAGASRLAVRDGATLNYRSGSFDSPPVYRGSITLVADNPPENATIDPGVWPATPPSLVSILQIGSSVQNASRVVKLPGSRTVNKTLNLLAGTLDLNGMTLTILDGATIRRQQTSSLLTSVAGSFLSTGNNVSVIYEPNASTRDGGDLKTGNELPTAVKNLMFTRSGNVANALVTLQSAVSVQGTLEIHNDIVTSANGSITCLGDLTIAADTLFSAATTPVIALNSPITFAGTVDEQIQVPSTGVTIGSMVVSKPGGNIFLLGGDLKCNGSVTFNRGLVVTGEKNALVLTRQAGTATQGFIRNVSSGAKSHVVGNVRQNLITSSVVLFARHEFPVGDFENYRPVTLTFHNVNVNGSSDLGVTATASHTAERPSGFVGLPIPNGIDENTSLGRYPRFYWTLSTSDELGASTFNIGLTAAGFDPTEIALNDVILNKVKIIRREGGKNDIQNQWTLQGTIYDNFVINGVPTVVSTASSGGLRPRGAIFTYGLKSLLFIANPIGDQTLPAGGRILSMKLTSPPVFGGNTSSFTFSASSSNPTVAGASIAGGDTLIVQGLIAGVSTIRVTASNPIDGQISMTFVITVTGTPSQEPTEFSLAQNYPNPFNGSTTIRFSLPKEAPVTLEIHNLLGVKVRTLIPGETMNAAFHSIVWDGKDDRGVSLPSGVYLYRIHADKFVSSKKMTLVK